MKLNKMIFLLIPFFIQGCNSFFEEKYDEKELFDRVTGLQDINTPSRRQLSPVSIETQF